MRSAIDQSDADVLALQEVMPDQLADLREAYRQDYRILSGTKTGDEVNAVMVKRSWIEICASGEILVDANPTGDVPLRSIVWADLALSIDLERDSKIRFASTHLDARPSQAESASNDALGLSPGNVEFESIDALILAGDFNSIPSTDPWDVPNNLPYYEGIGLVDLWAQANPNNKFPSGCGAMGDCTPFDFDARIDWILGTNGVFQAVGAGMLNVQDVQTQVNASDHQLVWVDLVLR